MVLALTPALSVLNSQFMTVDLFQLEVALATEHA